MIFKFSSRNRFVAVFAESDVASTVDNMHLIVASRNLATTRKIFGSENI